MTWRPMTEAPKTDEPVLLKAGEDIGTATRGGERLVSEAEALAREPERELAALVAHRDAINREIAALDAAELAEQRQAEQERRRQVRSLLPGGDA